MRPKFDMIGLFVGDLQTMVTFYRDVLGIACVWNGEGPAAEFDHEGIRFMMFERAMLPELIGQEPTYPSGLNGSFELAINVGAKEQVDSTYQRLLDAGAQSIYPPRDEPWKMRSAMIADPEGNLIEIGSDFWE